MRGYTIEVDDESRKESTREQGGGGEGVTYKQQEKIKWSFFYQNKRNK